MWPCTGFLLLQFPHPWTGTRNGLCVSYGVSWKLWVWKEADYVEAAGAGQESFAVFIVTRLPTSRMALGLRNEALCFLGPLGNRTQGVTWVGTCRNLSPVPRSLKWEAVSSPFLLLITINRTECYESWSGCGGYKNCLQTSPSSLDLQYSPAMHFSSVRYLLWSSGSLLTPTPSVLWWLHSVSWITSPRHPRLQKEDFCVELALGMNHIATCCPTYPGEVQAQHCAVPTPMGRASVYGNYMNSFPMISHMHTPLYICMLPRYFPKTQSNLTVYSGSR